MLLEANPNVKINFGLKLKGTVFKKLIIGYSVGAFQLKEIVELHECNIMKLKYHKVVKILIIS